MQQIDPTRQTVPVQPSSLSTGIIDTVKSDMRTRFNQEVRTRTQLLTLACFCF